MFSNKKKSEPVEKRIIDTIIGENTKIQGILTASDSTRVDGLVKGKIQSESSVIVGEKGTIRGDINANDILVAGTVYGNLIAREKIELTETGRVRGDLITKTLVIDEGASFKGNCTMEVMEERKPEEDFGQDFETEFHDEMSGAEDQPYEETVKTSEAEVAMTAEAQSKYGEDILDSDK